MVSKSRGIWMTILLIMGMVLGSVSGVFAASTSDIEGHWAEERLHDWMERGLLSGYEDDTVRPNQPVTRAEFVSMANRAFGFTSGSTVSFSDVTVDHWSSNQIAFALQEGYINGYEDGTFRPDREVSRQEVAVMVAAILELDPSASAQAAKGFTDAGEIAGWSVGAVGAIAEQGIMQGYENKSFQPTASITRAEAVVTIDNALSVYDEIWAVVYSEAGTYGPEAGTETVSGNVLVRSDGVTLQNFVVAGDLTLGKGIGEGEATLDNVTVEGTTTIRGGGENSIYVQNSTLQTVVVNKENGNVRMVSSRSTTMEQVRVTGNNSTVILSGDYANVHIEVPGVTLVLEDGSIRDLTVAADAGSANIHVAQGADIRTLTLDAAATVTGEGLIQKAIVNANGSSFEREPRQIELADGVTVEVGGEVVEESTRPFFGGYSGRSNRGRNAVTVEEMHDIWLLEGSAKEITVVTDPEDVGFTALSSDPSVVEAVYETRESGDKIITVTGLGIGSATVTVDVYKDGYRGADETFVVTVLESIEAIENETVRIEAAGGLEIENLPGGAKVGATLIDIADETGVEAAGPIVNIVLEGEVPASGVVVRLPVENEDAGLYFYDEETGTWELQEGSMVINVAGELFVEATVYHFSIYGALVNTAELIASNITDIAAPDEGVTALALPQVPHGFAVRIQHSSNTDIIALDGTITPPETDTSVDLVLEVTRESDDSTARTGVIEVVVPGSPTPPDRPGDGEDPHTLTFAAVPADAVSRLGYQIDEGEEFEVIDNTIELPADADSIRLHAHSVDGKALLNSEVEGFGGYSVTYKGVMGNEVDSLHVYDVSRLPINSSVRFHYVNEPDMDQTEIELTPGAPGSKSVDVVVKARDASGEPIVGIGPGNVSLIMTTHDGYDMPFPLNNYYFDVVHDTYGVEITDIDDDLSDDVISFTVTFTHEGAEIPQRYISADHGSEVEFTLQMLRVTEEGLIMNLPEAEKDPEVEDGIAPLSGNGMSPSPEETIEEGEVSFTFGFKSQTGALEKLSLDLYWGDNVGEGRVYSGDKFADVNLPADQDGIDDLIDQVTDNFAAMTDGVQLFMEALGYDSSDASSIQTMKENVTFETEDGGTSGTWTMKMDVSRFAADQLEFLVEVRDTRNVKWGNNNYNNPDKGQIQNFLYDIAVE